MEAGSDVVSAVPNRNCVTCGRAIDWQANVCPYCGHDYRMAAAVPVKPRTAKPVIGGILVIIAGLLALSMGIFYIVIDPGDIEEWGYTPARDDISLSELEDVLGVCGAIEIVVGAIAVIGGAFAVARKRFGLAIVGAIFGMIGIGFLIGGLLGMIGLILVALSRSEF